ncbi:nucleoside kinase [Clostridium ganghwense]|uniref:Nucleoside kinase n=1 Tax=Clostridium ganghwense TaxID=312089 RepID=A0ABT4CKI0_9CLOT|nr:nucleoside kinase [Clostridium ganghwense]MCY6369555.1 nucleoside kinase [Clostridium ganghwense]
MGNINLSLKNGKKIVVDKGTTLHQIVVDNNLQNDVPCILGRVNGRLRELNNTIEEDGYFEGIDITNKIARLAYVRTLQFVLIKAVYDLYPSATITIEHSISKGIFGEIHKETPLNSSEIIEIKNKMQEIIDKDIKINKISVTKEKAVKIFKKYGMEDKIRLLKHVSSNNLKLYELDGRYDYFYGSMAYSTGVLKLFDLMYYEPGFILKAPISNNPRELPQFIDHKKLAKIFYETEQWGEILGVADVGSLNDIVMSGEITTMIRIAEALHEKKIAYTADMIYKRPNTKIVLIAGPSSSGKTTFTKRLGIQLRVNGLVPILISLDDYFVDREYTPKDENGEYNFESIYALDLPLFNKNLCQLLNGEEVIIPRYDFLTGTRKWHEKPLKLPHNGILLIEGIHGLNEMLTASIPRENKFKIYISALTQLNLDNHNRISTTDVRRIRRIVRDYLSRGYGAEDTLKMWPSIKRGEENNIFVFQEEADVMFNSNLVYELCVLKKYAEPELRKIKQNSPVYYEAMRLKSFLHFFKDVDKELVPDNSILREFVGGSFFYKY